MLINRNKAILAVLLIVLFVTGTLTGCGTPALSPDFDEREVSETVQTVIDLVNDGDAQGLLDISTVQMRQALTEEALALIFEAIGECGEFEKLESVNIGGKTDKANGEEFAVAVVKAKYEIKSIIYTLSFTKQMKLAGLYYR